MHLDTVTTKSCDNNLGTRHRKNNNSKSNTKPNRIWKIFQTKNDKRKILER